MNEGQAQTTGRTLEFIVTLDGASLEFTRADFKNEIYRAVLSSDVGRHSASITVWRYNRPAQVRRGKVMQAASRADADELARLRARIAETTERDEWRETVRDLFDDLHFGEDNIFTGNRLASRIVQFIEARHPDYFGAERRKDVTNAK